MFEKLDVNEIQSFFKLVNTFNEKENLTKEEKKYSLYNINKIYCLLQMTEEQYQKTLNENYNITVNFENNKIKMIRFLRVYTSMSLKDCKDYIENSNEDVYNIITPYYSFAILIRNVLRIIDLEHKLTVDVEEDEE